MKSHDDNLPDIPKICAEVRHESNPSHAFAILDKLCTEVVVNMMLRSKVEAHRKAISEEDARDIVESFEELAERFADADRRSEAAGCYAAAAHFAMGFSGVEDKIVPALNSALGFSDFLDVNQDVRFTLKIGNVITEVAARGISFDRRDESVGMKYDERLLASSIIESEKNRQLMTPGEINSFIRACAAVAGRHTEAGRFKSSAYWLAHGAGLALKISKNDLAFSLWYTAGLCNDVSKANNFAEQAGCFLFAIALLPYTRKPNEGTDKEAFEERLDALQEMGFFFLSDTTGSLDQRLRVKGAECFLQAFEDLKEARREGEYYRRTAGMRSQLGSFYLETDELDRAQTQLREAVTAWKKTLSQQPGVPNIRSGFAETLNLMGLTLEKMSDKSQAGGNEQVLREAQGYFKEAREVYRDLFAITSPSNTKVRAGYHLRAQKLASNQARVAGSHGNWDDAVSILEGAVQFEEKLRKSLQCDTFDSIKQELRHARSHRRRKTDEPSQTISDGHPKKQKPRNRNRN